MNVKPLDHDSDEDVYSIQAEGYTSFRISRDTINTFFRPLLRDEPIVQHLIGKEYAYPYVTVFHFNGDGQVFRMEPRAELVGAISTMVQDPFVRAKLLMSSNMTNDGCLTAYTEVDRDFDVSADVSVACEG